MAAVCTWQWPHALKAVEQLSVHEVIVSIKELVEVIVFIQRTCWGHCYLFPLFLLFVFSFLLGMVRKKEQICWGQDAWSVNYESIELCCSQTTSACGVRTLKTNQTRWEHTIATSCFSLPTMHTTKLSTCALAYSHPLNRGCQKSFRGGAAMTKKHAFGLEVAEKFICT